MNRRGRRAGGLKRPLHERTQGSHVVAGKVHVAARVAAVSVGPFRVERPIVALVEPGLGSVDDGTLGSGFLNRFTIGLDFEGRQMHLAPNPSFRTEQLFDASGMAFRRTAVGHEVRAVLPESPAARAGIRGGDTLLSIDGTPVLSLTPNHVRDLFARGGHTCDLALTRAGQPLRIRLVLQQRLCRVDGADARHGWIVGGVASRHACPSWHADRSHARRAHGRECVP